MPAYQREFGEEISYSEDVIEAVEENATIDSPNASIEWLYRFLNNEPVFQSSTTKIFKEDTMAVLHIPHTKALVWGKLLRFLGSYHSEVDDGLHRSSGYMLGKDSVTSRTLETCIF